MTLGSAFQEVNFLRDMKDDYFVLGRTYFPNVDISDFDNEVKSNIEKEIESEFREALEGIKKITPFFPVWSLSGLQILCFVIQ